MPSARPDNASGITPPPAAIEGLTLLRQIAAACVTFAETGTSSSFDLSPLDPVTRARVADMLGKGAILVERRGPDAIAAQESRFAGIWLLSGPALDRVEVAPIPTAASERPFAPIRPAQGLKAARGKSVSNNAPALCGTLRDRSEAYVHGSDLFVVNLSVLPHTEEDLLWLDAALGEGAVTIISRGDTNCRMTATAVPNLWRVQFFNSINLLTLDTFEVTHMPEIATAAAEDLAESGARLFRALGTPQ
jgi:hydrogenase-1 operon protein HyaF